MANSACPKCGNHSFELTSVSPSGSNYKFNFIQCSKFGCGTVVGVVDYFHIPTKIDTVQKAVEASKSSTSSSSNQQVLQNFQGLFYNVNILDRKLNTILERLEKLEGKDPNVEVPE